ncbi:MAG TPA: hypothetical protein VF585_10685 [Chthoniobacterales bacterium]
MSEKCFSEAKQIGLACKLYAADHEGIYPETLEQLVPEYLPDAKMLTCELVKGEPGQGYEYLGGKDTDPADTILLRSKAATRSGKKIFIYSNQSGLIKKE